MKVFFFFPSDNIAVRYCLSGGCEEDYCICFNKNVEPFEESVIMACWFAVFAVSLFLDPEGGSQPLA